MWNIKREGRERREKERERGEREKDERRMYKNSFTSICQYRAEMKSANGNSLTCLLCFRPKLFFSPKKRFDFFSSAPIKCQIRNLILKIASNFRNLFDYDPLE